MVEPEKFMRMPKSCFSCTKYQNLGFDHDKHCPFKAQFASSEPKTRTPYGQCSVHGQEVFATEICNSYDPEPHVIPFDVDNRPEPRAPIQERLTLIEVIHG